MARDLVHPILATVPFRAHRYMDIGGIVGRDTTHMYQQPKSVLEDAGFLTKSNDVLTEQAPASCPFIGAKAPAEVGSARVAACRE